MTDTRRPPNDVRPIGHDGVRRYIRKLVARRPLPGREHPRVIYDYPKEG